MGVSSSRLDLEDSVLNSEDGHIEGTTSKIEDENVALSMSLLVESVGDGGSSWLVDDTKDVESRDGSGILGGLTLRVVEVGWDGDNGVLDGASEEGFSGLLHLQEDHRRDLLRSEDLGLSLVLDLDLWLGSFGGDDLEWPMLHVRLNCWVVELAPDETLGI
ncbi:hypothetical protein GCK72_012056 [Caenorhabditis remanei]|uniref:Uncharacterized protein n=1 Tax=Caenorhabditis remanei TaxID=31234 RepID=A0A6A5GLU1_CAERE|nr:hypothetical protein GCK72_012056 [Caenorhabditis remanei]KAF1755606.1 hypothetical protein GCK72_012056 [Caenorhabditis remanei]